MILDEIADQKVIIVANFTAEIADISRLLYKKKKKYGIISGSISDNDREEYINDFSKGKLDNMILQLKAGGLGINGLQNHCSYMIFFSNDYTWDYRQQAEARIMRSGQKESCTYIDLIAVLPENKSTIDEIVLQNLENKDNNIKSLIDNFIKEAIQK